jgi:hypothetical protein
VPEVDGRRNGWLGQPARLWTAHSVDAFLEGKPIILAYGPWMLPYGPLIFSEVKAHDIGSRPIHGCIAFTPPQTLFYHDELIAVQATSETFMLLLMISAFFSMYFIKRKRA